jgi:hypothetical protein
MIERAVNEGLYRRWLLRAASAVTPSMRQGLWYETLRTYPPDRGAGLIDYIARKARSTPEAKAVYLPLVDRQALLGKVGAANLYEILECARDAKLQGCQLVLHSGKARTAKKPDQAPDPVTAQLSLGHQKNIARGLRTPVMERLLKSHDPEVVREALRNPRLREEEVVAIASRRPCAEEVFNYLVAAPGWIARPIVQRSVVFNPYAAPSLAVPLLICLPAQTLQEVHKDKKLHPSVRDGALEIISWACR